VARAASAWRVSPARVPNVRTAPTLKPVPAPRAPAGGSKPTPSPTASGSPTSTTSSFPKRPVTTPSSTPALSGCVRVM
jgi:hypothetical protein